MSPSYKRDSLTLRRKLAEARKVKPWLDQDMLREAIEMREFIKLTSYTTISHGGEL